MSRLHCCIPKTDMSHFIKRIILFLVPYRVYVQWYLRLKCSGHIYLYGAGAIGVEILEYLRGRTRHPIIWVDLKANAKLYQFLGKTVNPTTLLQNVVEGDVVVICSEATIESMVNECLRQGVDKHQVVFRQ